MKILRILAVPAFVGSAFAGEHIRPITNPVWHGPAEVGTSIHPIFIHQAHPDVLDTQLGKVPAGGDFQVYALQLEIKLAKNLSLIAVKDGYVDFNPDETFAQTEGFADLAAGLKRVVHRTDTTVVSTRAVIELPTGDDEVWQGNGDGLIAPAVTCASRLDKLQLGGTLGVHIPFSDEESTIGYYALHASYALTEQVHPVIELNHFRTLDAGDGGNRFTDHVGGGVAGVAHFEGGDLINFGASNAEDDDQLSLGLGCRFLVSDQVSLGAAYEIPLSEEEEGLMDYRVTADVLIKL